MMSAQNEMEKAVRDKVGLINQLETAKLQIKRYDQEVSLVCNVLHEISIYLLIMSNSCWGPRHMRVKLQEY